MRLKKSDFTEKTVFVNVTKALNNGFEDIDPSQTPLVDIARGTWRLNLDKANQCGWLMAVANDEIRGVWEIIGSSDESGHGRWIEVVSLSQLHKAIPTRKWTLLGDERRYFCEAKDVDADVAKKYLQAKMSEIDGLGHMYGPVRYSF